MLILTRAETESLLEPDALRQAVAAAMADVSAGRASMPARTAAVVDERGGMLAAMLAYLPGVGGLGAKLISLFPGNANGPVPTHQGVVLVFDDHTGTPVALLDGTSITAARTAAGSALSIELLARPDSATLAILGTGVQARSHAVAALRVRPFTEIRVVGRDPGRTQALVAHLASLTSARITVADSFPAACAGADVVCATTHSADPVVRGRDLAPGTHVTSVGYNVAGRELDSDAVAAALVVVEQRAAVLAPPPSGSTDLRIPIEEGRIGPDHIHAEIGELVAGTKPGRASADQITLYKSVGVAAQDIAAAGLVLERARAAGVGVTVEL